jgi:hypothetical protein
MKPFLLYVCELKGTADRVLIQLLGSWNCLVAYCQNNLMLFPEAGCLACVL